MATSVGSSNEIGNPYNHGALSPTNTAGAISTVDMRDGGSSAQNSSVADSPTSVKTEGLPQYRNSNTNTTNKVGGSSHNQGSMTSLLLGGNASINRSTASNGSTNTSPAARMHSLPPAYSNSPAGANSSFNSSPADAIRPPPYFATATGPGSAASPNSTNTAGSPIPSSATPPPYAKASPATSGHPAASFLVEGDVAEADQRLGVGLEQLATAGTATANVSSLISRGPSATGPSHLQAPPMSGYAPHYAPSHPVKGHTPNNSTPSMAPSHLGPPNSMSNSAASNIVEPIIVRNGNGVFLLTPLSQMQSSQIIASMQQQQQQMQQQVVGNSAGITPHMTPHTGPAMHQHGGKDRLGAFGGSHNNLSATLGNSSRQSPMATGMPPPYAGAAHASTNTKDTGNPASPIPTCPLPPPASPFLGYAMGTGGVQTGTTPNTGTGTIGTPNVGAAVPNVAVTPLGANNKAPPRYPGSLGGAGTSPYPTSATPSYSPAAYPTVPNNSIIMAGGGSFGLPPPAYAGGGGAVMGGVSGTAYSPPAYGAKMPPSYDGR